MSDTQDDQYYELLLEKYIRNKIKVFSLKRIPMYSPRLCEPLLNTSPLEYTYHEALNT